MTAPADAVQAASPTATTSARDLLLARRLAAVLGSVRQAERSVGRPEGSVRVVAVSKTMPLADVCAAACAGQVDFGESYAQELESRLGSAAGVLPPGTRWHFIGGLQRNKAKMVAGRVALLHSIDSLALLEEIDRHAALALAPGERQSCLVQVNIVGEASKKGVPPGELPALLDRFATLTRVRCEGLMLIPPKTSNMEEARIPFVALRRLLEREATVERPNVSLRELSMGMSGDYEAAIREGATLVRIGSAIFGERVTRVPAPASHVARETL